MIVLWPAVVGSKLNSHTKVLLLVAAVVVGFLSKILIEDRFRGSRGDAAPTVPRHASSGRPAPTSRRVSSAQPPPARRR